MAKSYYSTVLDVPADQVWARIRAFDDYGWAGAGYEAHMEDGAQGDAVGGVRRIGTGSRPMRQRLLAHSDLDRSYAYTICEPSPYPVRDYQGTLRVTPVVDGGRAFVEWWATFDCADDQRDHWTGYFAHEGFARWLTSLRDELASRPYA